MICRRIVLTVLLCGGCAEPVAISISASSEAAVHAVISARQDLAALLGRVMDDDSIAEAQEELEQAFADLDEAESRLAAIADTERIAVQKKFRNELNAALDQLMEQQARMSPDSPGANFTRQAATASKTRRRAKRGGPAGTRRQPTKERSALEPVTDDDSELEP
jgi:hypothetical protein